MLIGGDWRAAKAVGRVEQEIYGWARNRESNRRASVMDTT